MAALLVNKHVITYMNCWQGGDNYGGEEDEEKEHYRRTYYDDWGDTPTIIKAASLIYKLHRHSWIPLNLFLSAILKPIACEVIAF